MIVYDATNRSSLEYVTGWLVQVDEHAHESLVLMLVGSKCNPAHLPESREVSTLEAARFAAKYSWSAMWSNSRGLEKVALALKKRGWKPRRSTDQSNDQTNSCPSNTVVERIR
ncbi:hypothetical protein PF002_g19608 [Phytophthora fragariae]|uniref:Uncharacterized protein n=1 Tax=Phytophthora fragariae TaxID=53985 RepID=A0A6A3XT09_9STRA|nr:hypothetical protein PF002_g19608 [Phytophthora fragariae]